MSAFLLEAMENEHCLGKPDRVDRSVCASGIVLDDFQNTRASKPFQNLGRGMLFPKLGEMKCVTHESANAGRQGKQILFAGSHPKQRSFG